MVKIFLYSIFISSIFLYVQSTGKLRAAWKIYFICLILAVIHVKCGINNDDFEWRENIVTGSDTSKEYAIFKIKMLNDKFTWKYKSDHIIQLNGEDFSLLKYLNSPEIKSELNNSINIICIGNSSHEGSRNIEEKRAFDRANQLSKLIRQVVDEPEKVKMLCLGVNEISNSESENQRRIVLLLTLKKSKNVNLKVALKNALMKDVLPFSVNQYSMFLLR